LQQHSSISEKPEASLDGTKKLAALVTAAFLAGFDVWKRIGNRSRCPNLAENRAEYKQTELMMGQSNIVD
jgi:hypothetical protein